MSTNTGPVSGNSGGWSDFFSNAGNLIVDAARSRLGDVERHSDDRNIPDNVDMRTTPGAATPQAGGIALVKGISPMMLGLGLLAVAAVVVLVRR